MTVSRDSGVSAQFIPKDNFHATTAPGVSHDASAGYSIGSTWIDTVTDSVYHCTDATVGAANWVDVTGGGSGGGTWGSITGTLGDQTDLSSALALKAPAASPTFTGTVTAPAGSTTYPITAVNQGLRRFTVTGPARNSLAGGQTFTVAGSTGNNGIYTVSTVSYSAPNTTITVSEAIPSAVADGNVTNIFGTVQITDGQVKMADPAGDAFYVFVDSAGQFLIQCQVSGGNRGIAPVAISKDASNMWLNVTTLNASGSTATFGTLSASTMTGPVFGGDSGTGGTKGILPAPAAGDAAAKRFLSAGGTWEQPSARTFNLTGPILVESDFLNTGATIAGTNRASADVFAYQSVTATGSGATIASTANHPGVVQLINTASAGSYSALLLGKALADAPALPAELDTFILIAQPITNGGAVGGTLAGLSSNLSVVNPVDGIFFSITSTTNIDCITRASSTETKTSITVSDVTSVWKTLKIVKSGASIGFYIDGSLVATHTTNIPSAAINAGVASFYNGSAISGVNVDYMGYKTTAITR